MMSWMVSKHMITDIEIEVALRYLPKLITVHHPIVLKLGGSQMIPGEIIAKYRD